MMMMMMNEDLMKHKQLTWKSVAAEFWNTFANIFLYESTEITDVNSSNKYVNKKKEKKKKNEKKNK